MKYDEESLKKLLNDMPFDDSIRQSHKASLKNEVIRTHMTSAGSKTQKYMNVAIIVFAFALGFIITIQIWRNKATTDHAQKEQQIVQIVSAPPANAESTSTQPIWSRDTWKKRLASMQTERHTNQRLIIWTSPTQNPIQGDAR